MTALQADIEKRLADSEPDVEVLLAEVVGGRQLRVFIDHPEGVTVEVCERVSACLNELRERYSLEVSSPGTERPLTKPAHFRRFIGRRARVLAAPGQAAPGQAAPGQAAPGRSADPGRSVRHRRPRGNFTGELVGASDQEVTLAAADGIVTIPYTEIRRSNLVEE